MPEPADCAQRIVVQVVDDRPRRLIDIAEDGNDNNIRSGPVGIYSAGNAWALWSNFLKEIGRERGVVFVRDREQVERRVKSLRTSGIRAFPYIKNTGNVFGDSFAQNSSDSCASVLVATSGSILEGVKDLRFVAHLNAPKSLEDYCQDISYAARTAWLCYGLRDVIERRASLSESTGGPQQQHTDALAQYMETTDCRSRLLRSLVGGPDDDACGQCDNCISPPHTWDATEAVQKALSCVYRGDQRLNENDIVDVLRGGGGNKFVIGAIKSRIPDIQGTSVWGIGKDLTENVWRSVLRHLLAHGYLDVDRQRAIRLTPRSRTALKGESEIRVRFDGDGREYPLSEIQKRALEVLLAWRSGAARAQGIPSYMVFHNSVLPAIACAMPKTLDQLARVPGIGASKVKGYGEEVIGQLRPFLDTE